MIDRHAIDSAAARIGAFVRHTPVIDVAAADLGLDHDKALSLKLELLQHTGSFKPRGAFNTLLARDVPPAGVAAASGGNHGAAVAWAAQHLGHKATIFVPEISSPVKIARIRQAGAEIVIGGARYHDALAACDEFAARSGALAVHAYDARETIAGQGTVAREWQSDVPDLDTVLVAVGGGGLIAGIARWFDGDVRVVGVEPTGSNCLHAALAAGHPVDVEVNSLAADSLGARRTGDMVFHVARELVDRVVLVGDDDILDAQGKLWSMLRIAAEPGGAAALAALSSGAYRPAAGERVGVLVCGANVDLATLAIAAGAMPSD